MNTFSIFSDIIRLAFYRTSQIDSDEAHQLSNRVMDRASRILSPLRIAIAFVAFLFLPPVAVYAIMLVFLFAAASYLSALIYMTRDWWHESRKWHMVK